MLPVTTNDKTIPVVFRVDNHFRIKKALAKKLGLDRKRSLKIVDAAGNVWDVRVGIESPDGQFYIKDMKQFVKDKKMVPREEFTLKFVMGKGIFLFD
ncbi:putative transcription factor B3-Domain family [Helianthus annuus]|nr:putative transcription factor B3-Domain family [Helianthus annuus]KAJ0517978.1 putative transcription factor B3-Domain family [Helianthus annuus]KAJ0685998.1 putative transcription factor B3-Domain family [Helianthus annuus]KAJ0689853.1 putative transcription factor B3-Domain family [Helianthus annuus]KAJ0871262.1 putative transcription factor B3-Domain family [Helianthus annuus]